MTDWAGKLVGAIARIAAILHVAKLARTTSPWTKPVNESTMKKAIQVGEYLIIHAKAAFSLMGADHATENAKYILRWIENKGSHTFSQRDLHQDTRKGRFSNIEDLTNALVLLVEHHFLRKLTVEDSGKPGRKKGPEYEVNPSFPFQRPTDAEVNFEDFEDIEENLEIVDKDYSLGHSDEVIGSDTPRNPQNPQNGTIPANMPKPAREVLRL